MEKSVLKKIRKLLVESDKPISSKEIAEKLEIDPGPNSFVIRSYILECINLLNLPIAGTSDGYFLLSNVMELNDYIKKLNERIGSIRNEIEQIINNYDNSHDNLSFLENLTTLKKSAAIIEDEVIDQGSGMLLLKDRQKKIDDKTNIDPLDEWLSSTVSGDEETDSVEEHDVVH